MALICSSIRLSRLELADLERQCVAVGVADGGHEHLRVRYACLVQRLHELRQLCDHLPGHLSHRARHVEDDDDGRGVRVLVEVERLADDRALVVARLVLALRVEEFVDLPLAACGVWNVRLRVVEVRALRQTLHRGRAMDLAAVSAVSHVCSLLSLADSGILPRTEREMSNYGPSDPNTTA